MALGEWISGRMFQFVHRNNLVYNTCWEDPRLDHEALELGTDDNVLVITSAGCNALDYALAGPNRIVAVDMNPRQNALLELKIAAIRNMQHYEFFAMFGEGKLTRVEEIYHQKLRSSLSLWSQRYWDRWITFFDPSSRRPFYYRGTCGAFAMLMNFYINKIAKLRPGLEALLRATSLEEQREIFDDLHDRFWTRSIRFAMNRDSTLSLLGVPRAQRRQIEIQYGGISRFIHDCLTAVFSYLPLSDNYFWRVYMTGQYTPDCCPEYLKPENFQKLKDGLVNCIETHTDSVQGFLETHEMPISRFVLLDHMDWMAGHRLPMLQEEWQWIVRRSSPETRLIWRSGGLRTDFVDDLNVLVGNSSHRVGELLSYHPDWAKSLHQQCRVHTYGSFYIADLCV